MVFDRSRRRINEGDRHESRRYGCGSTLFLAMFFDPRVEGIDGAADLACDSGDGRVLGKGNGVPLDFGGVANARHRERQGETARLSNR